MVGPALTFEVSATEAVARISVAMNVLNIFDLHQCFAGEVRYQAACLPLCATAIRSCVNWLTFACLFLEA